MYIYIILYILYYIILYVYDIMYIYIYSVDILYVYNACMYKEMCIHITMYIYICQ